MRAPAAVLTVIADFRLKPQKGIRTFRYKDLVKVALKRKLWDLPVGSTVVCFQSGIEDVRELGYQGALFKELLKSGNDVVIAAKFPSPLSDTARLVGFQFTSIPIRQAQGVIPAEGRRDPENLFKLLQAMPPLRKFGPQPWGMPLNQINSTYRTLCELEKTKEVVAASFRLERSVLAFFPFWNRKPSIEDAKVLAHFVRMNKPVRIYISRRKDNPQDEAKDLETPALIAFNFPDDKQPLELLGQEKKLIRLFWNKGKVLNQISLKDIRSENISSHHEVRARLNRKVQSRIGGIQLLVSERNYIKFNETVEVRIDLW